MNNQTRQIVIDTETTGLDPEMGHRVIEIGAIELCDRQLTGNNRHYYLNPDRLIDQEAQEVHGITNEFLADKPRFPDIAEEFIHFIRDAELIIHNAPFDVGFLDAEFRRLHTHSRTTIQGICEVLDTLALARAMHPGQKNSLDALCKRYHINNAHRTLHGALLDAEILAAVYLAMTGGQINLFDQEQSNSPQHKKNTSRHIKHINRENLHLIVHHADAEALRAHQKIVDDL